MRTASAEYARIAARVELSEPTESLPGERVDLWCASLVQSQTRLRELANLLSADERGRVSRIRFARDRERYVAGRGQLRVLLAAYTNRTPRELRFSYGEYGKPSLVPVSGSSDLRFNLSHSGQYVLYALTSGREVGVDLERVRPIEDAREIVDRWFSEEERERFRSTTGAERNRLFFALWTRREALLKGRGTGISGFSDTGPVISESPSLDTGVPTDAWTAPGGWSVHSLEPVPNYVAALAVEGGPVELKYRLWSSP